MPKRRHPSIKRMRKKRKKSIIEKRRKSSLRKQARSRMLMTKQNDRLITIEFRQKLRIQNLTDIRQQVEYIMRPALFISTLKDRVNKATRESINVEVQNTLQFIYKTRSIIEKMFARQKTTTDLGISRVETDSENARRRIARIYLLFKSFDFDKNADKSKYIPLIEEKEQFVKEDTKLQEILADEQRYLSQQKSLKMEIEDNEIRLIAKEQILRERIEEQNQIISDLTKQIVDMKRRMGLLPTVSSIRFMESSRRLSMAFTPNLTQGSNTNVLILRQ